MAEPTNTYEFTYIINAVLSEQQIKETVEAVTRLITENGGEIIEQSEWGTQRMAYPIDKKRNGYYVNLYFRAPGALIVRLERSLQINENILRYLTLRYDAKMLRHFDQRKDRPALKLAGGQDEEAHHEEDEDED